MLDSIGSWSFSNLNKNYLKACAVYLKRIISETRQLFVACLRHFFVGFDTAVPAHSAYQVESHLPCSFITFTLTNALRWAHQQHTFFLHKNLSCIICTHINAYGKVLITIAKLQSEIPKSKTIKCTTFERTR